MTIKSIEYLNFNIYEMVNRKALFTYIKVQMMNQLDKHNHVDFVSFALLFCPLTSKNINKHISNSVDKLN